MISSREEKVFAALKIAGDQIFPMASSSGTKKTTSRRMSRQQTRSVEGPNEDDSEVVPSSLSSIVPILRVAKEIETDNPRVAYLCESLILSLAHFLYFASLS